ncbi:hypothetical protein [Hymenobacter guriensis]|uniref:Uncharacterized protein n=1 Tax=Hymenobacter guriensis TaxID=2793065 RepID=A0ABS0L5B6_9BACT|nr:hypothetical protein [Hymenobacter guriensis]MBG8555340.1 hypothetical protein [Hymenobacter guriensis]
MLLSSFQQDRPSYNFRISIPETDNNVPEKIIVNIVNNSKEDIYFNNLLFIIFVDNEQFYGFMSNARFFNKRLNLKNKEQFNKAFFIDSMNFNKSDVNHPKSVKFMKDKMKSGRNVSIKASLHDWQLVNGFSSNFNTYSNIVNLKVK